MKFEPTSTQKEAIEITDNSIILSAGAGSGKTRVLVQRYLHLLEKRLAKVEEILAITFTNKAAGEMKERIIQEVFKLIAKADSSLEKKFWLKVKEDLNLAQITTFHGFCAQILRSNPIRIGVDPYFRVLEEEESDELLDEVMEDIFLTGLEDPKSKVVILVREYGIYYIMDLLKNGYTSSRNTSLSLEELATQSLNTLEKSIIAVENLKREICQLIEDMLEINRNSNLSAGTKARLEILEQKWADFSFKIFRISTLSDQDRAVLKEIRGILSGNLAKGVKEKVSRLREIIDYAELEQYLADLRAIELIPVLVNVLQQIDERYSEIKQKLGCLDFADLEKYAIYLLKNDINICKEYGNKYKFIMVDEFQDTNSVQEELIRLLISGNPNFPIEGNRLFIVGDPKQSIYRFRGADVRIFKKLESEIRQIGREVVLSTNFRSRRKIIDFANHFFQQVFNDKENDYDIQYQKSESFRQGEVNDKCIEFMILDEIALKEEELNKRRAEADQLAKRIVKMVQEKEELVYEKNLEGIEVKRSVNYGDICILFQALTNVQIYEEAMQRYKIPYIVVNGRGFFERQEIYDLLNLLKLVDNPSQKLLWAGILRSPFCGLSDEEIYRIFLQQTDISQVIYTPEKVNGLNETARVSLKEFSKVFHSVRENRDKKDISTLLLEILNETGYQKIMLAHPYGELIRANINKLLTKAREYEKNSHSSLAGFVRHIEKLEIRGTREGVARLPTQKDLVKLMSIHQSKGLEFPVIFIPDSQRQIINPAMNPYIFFDQEYGIGLKVKDPLHHNWVKTSLYNQIWEEEKKREIAESKRLFYVAATRARDYLLISGTLKEIKNSNIGSAKSWLEWLGIVWGFDTVSNLSETLTYGPGNEHQIRIRFSLQEMEMKNNHIHKGKIDIEKWKQTCHKFDDQILKPSLKTEYHKFGVTALMTFEKCPRWYYYRYIQQIPQNIMSPIDNIDLLGIPYSVDFWNTEVEKGGKNKKLIPSDMFGTLIHYICQYITSEDELGGLLQQARYQMDFGFFSSEQNRTILYDNSDIEYQIRPYIETFLRREAELQQMIVLNHAIDRREYSFNLVLDEFILSGVMDRVIVFGDEVLVLDYKSNNIHPDEVNDLAEWYHLQADIYALTIHYLVKVAKVRFVFYFIIPDKYLEIEYRPDDFLRTKNKIVNLQKGIIRSVEKGMSGNMLEQFPCNKTSEKCLYFKFCPYVNLCKKKYLA